MSVRGNVNGLFYGNHTVNIGQKAESGKGQ
jgi:hypothetical protein